MQFNHMQFFVGFFFLLLLLRIGGFYQCPNRSLKLGGIQKSDLEACLLLCMHKMLLYLLQKYLFFLRQELQIPLLPFSLRRTLLPKQTHLVQNKQQDI